MSAPATACVHSHPSSLTHLQHLCAGRPDAEPQPHGFKRTATMLSTYLNRAFLNIISAACAVRLLVERAFSRIPFTDPAIFDSIHGIWQSLNSGDLSLPQRKRVGPGHQVNGHSDVDEHAS